MDAAGRSALCCGNDGVAAQPLMPQSFPAGLEEAYRADYVNASLSDQRVGLALGAGIFTVFATLDLLMLPRSWPAVFWIRFGVMVPACLVVLGLTYVQAARRRLLLVISGLVVCLGFGMSGMIALAQPDEPGFRYYYAGLMLLLMSSFTVVRLQFRHAVACCIVVIAGYEWVAIFDQNLLAEGVWAGGGPELVNNSFFLLTSGLITVIGAYLFEDFSRRDFLQRSTIQDEKRIVEEKSRQLTEQRNELAVALDELQATQTQLVHAERTAAIGGIVAGLLHELNTPAGVIQSSADVVARVGRRLEQSESFESEKRRQTTKLLLENSAILTEATARVAQTLALLRRFTRLDQAAAAEYDVHEALDDCLQMLSGQTCGRIAIEKRLGELPKIRCLPAEVNHVFLSVLQNAVEAIPEMGRIELETSCREDSVLVKIQDTGVGIAADRLERIFAPQFQKDRSRVKLGLGLPTSQQIVERHGGSMGIESRLGQGTLVSVRLPIVARLA